MEDITQHYNQGHYDYFKQYLSFNQGLVGNNVKRWWDYVTDNRPCNLQLDKKFNREELKNLCCYGSDYSDEECLGAVMAWGGQNRKHGKILFSRKDEVVPIIASMRKGDLDYIEAYKKFDHIWKQDKSLGMGAAYFTKLIFFCEPSHQGFIMDQWTSKSTNLLCDENIVNLSQDHVSKKNDYQTYNKFCDVVQNIAANLNEPAEYIEMAMFSKGGRKKDAWRQYVVDNWRK